MRTVPATLVCLILAVALIAGCPHSAFSQENKGGPAGLAKQESGPATGDTLVYKPPMRGAPAGGGRIAAAVRGKEGEVPTLFVLAPDHVGLTAEKQPVLYWYISKPISSHLEFTLNDEQKGKTLIKADLRSQNGGIQVIKLSDYKAELSPGVVYQWFVTMESEPDQPAKDVYNGGNIMYQEPPADLKKKLAAAGGAGAPGIYAGEGIWYDAFSATWKPGKPGDEKSLKQQRITLLKQVGFGTSGPGKSKSVLDGEMEVLRFVGN